MSRHTRQNTGQQNRLRTRPDCKFIAYLRSRRALCVSSSHLVVLSRGHVVRVVNLAEGESCCARVGVLEKAAGGKQTTRTTRTRLRRLTTRRLRCLFDTSPHRDIPLLIRSTTHPNPLTRAASDPAFPMANQTLARSASM
jgi:hypothetical protein